MHKCTQAVLFLFFFTVKLFSQSFLKGKVVEKGNKLPLPGAMVSVDRNAIFSDTAGNFFMKTQVGKGLLFANLIGYKTYRMVVETKQGDTLNLILLLETSNSLLDEVVVSAGKYEQKLSDVTVSMEVIKPDLLQSKSITQLDQIMAQVPGLYVTDSQVSIRGGSGYAYGAGSRVMMLVDEMPMISADANDIKWNFIPIENMEQVEIIKGASSAIFGSSALNGVINMRTRYARDKPETQATLYSGIYGDPDRSSWNWWGASHQFNPSYQGGTFSHSQKLGNFDLVLGGQYFNDQGYRQGVTEKRARANINLRYHFKKIPGLIAGINATTMDDRGSNFFIWQSDSLALTPRPGTVQPYINERTNIDPFIEYHTKKGGRHSLRSRYFLTNNTNHIGLLNQSSTGELYYGEYQYLKRFKRDFNFSAGMVAMRNVVLAPYLYGNHFGENLAAYFQAEKKFFGRLTISAGARAEYYKVDTSQTHGGLFLTQAPKKLNLPFQPVFRVGMNYQLARFTFLRASFGQGYRFPSVAEKYITTNVGGLNLISNPYLQPEKGWSAETGIKQGFQIGNFKGFIDAAAFITEYNNMIDILFKYDTAGKTQAIFNSANPIASLTSYASFQSQNIGQAKITGYDISATGSGKIGKVGFTLLTGYTFSNPINPNFNPKVDTNGTSLTSVLRYRCRKLFKSDIQATWKGFSLGWSTRYSSFMENIDVRFEKPLIYELLNPNTSFYYNPNLYILPGLKKYRETHHYGTWVNDIRLAYQVNKYLKMSFLINNLFNVEFMSRPGLIEPPRTFIVQAVVKV